MAAVEGLMLDGRMPKPERLRSDTVNLTEVLRNLN
jgi:hypothetical protein